MRQLIANDGFFPVPRVTIFGVGGAGGNAVAGLLARPDAGLRIICANTDMQALQRVPKVNRLQLGRHLTSGFGAGAKPDTGRLAAEEALPEIRQTLAGTTLCFIAAGLGGGTGTGAAPVIAQAARAMGILTIAVATKPFGFEGARRSRVADAGSRLLEEQVDALVVVCNEHLIRVAGADATLRAALAQSDAVVCESASHFARLVAGPAVKRISVADMRAVLSSGGRTVMGFGQSHFGPGRAMHAARSALRNPLLEGVVTGARRLIVSVSGGQDLRLFEVDQAIAHVRAQVCANAEIVWGSVIDPALEHHVRIGIAAAGLPKTGGVEALPASTVARATQAVATSSTEETDERLGAASLSHRPAVAIADPTLELGAEQVVYRDKIHQVVRPGTTHRRWSSATSQAVSRHALHQPLSTPATSRLASGLNASPG